MASARENQISRSARFQFIINPSAGKGKYKQIIHVIQQSLSNSGLQLQYDIRVLSYRGEASSIARSAAESYDVVVAVGGDGTVNEVFNGIVGTKAVLGIIPAGTGNGFARGLGLPLNTEEACQVLTNGYVKGIDIGSVNGRYFLGTAGLGFDALIANAASKRLGPLRGMWLYFFAGAMVFYRYSPQLIDLEIDSERIKVNPLLVAVANTRRYGGNALIAPDALPDDGLFDVCVIQHMGFTELVWHLPKLFKGTHTRLSKVSMYKGKSIIIVAPNPVPVHVDGEAIGSFSKIQFKLLPKAIRVMAPRDLQT